jgi:hypothetical protein
LKAYIYIIFISLITCIYSGRVNANDDFNCTGSKFSEWSNCWGEATLGDGKYSGTFLNGQPHGSGLIIQTNGNKYEGEFLDGCFHGYGKLTYQNGDIYTGNFKKCKKHGEGMGEISDGTTYEFKYDNDILISSKEIAQLYTGPRKPSLEGEALRAASIEHEKQIKNQKIINYQNKDKYEGEIFNNKPNGLGTYTFANGSYYFGAFKDGKFQGNGEFVFSRLHRCKGLYENNKLEGMGKCSFENGDTYEGQFKNGLKNGNGIKHYKNGTIYDGEWLNGLKHGNGKFRFNKAMWISSKWVNGESTEALKKIRDANNSIEIRKSCYISCQLIFPSCYNKYLENGVECGLRSSSCLDRCDAVFKSKMYELDILPN